MSSSNMKDFDPFEEEAKPLSASELKRRNDLESEKRMKREKREKEIAQQEEKERMEEIKKQEEQHRRFKGKPSPFTREDILQSYKLAEQEKEEKRIADLAFKEQQKMIRKKENEQKQKDRESLSKHNKAAVWENRFEIMEGNPDITFEDFESAANLPTLNESIDAWDKIVRKKGKALVTPKEELPAKKDKLAFREAQSSNVMPTDKKGEIQMTNSERARENVRKLKERYAQEEQAKQDKKKLGLENVRKLKERYAKEANNPFSTPPGSDTE